MNKPIKQKPIDKALSDLDSIASEFNLNSEIIKRITKLLHSLQSQLNNKKVK